MTVLGIDPGTAVVGYGVLSEVRLRPESRAMPILVLSLRSQEHDIVRAIDAGSSGYVVKPFQPQELMARVRNLLRHAA